MLKIKIGSEPTDFFKKVESPGQSFLSKNPNPKDEDWIGKEYWRKVIPKTAVIYGRICAYSSTKIPYSTGNGSIDHFMPKDVYPLLAYTWSNYRYASARFNSRKGVKAILDPFSMNKKWFIMDLPSMIIKPNPRLNKTEKVFAQYTLDTLKLNEDDDLVDERFDVYSDFISGEITFKVVKKNYPFLASELKRLGVA